VTIQKILPVIHAFEEGVLAFRRKHGICSQTFCAAYTSGEDSADDRWVVNFGEGASAYRTRSACQA